jgi:transcriptional regulator with XRE-family HTH domain
MGTPVKKLVGKKIRLFRKKLDISQEELGFRSGLHRTYIGAIERGEYNLTIENLEKIAKALGIKSKDLL